MNVEYLSQSIPTLSEHNCSLSQDKFEHLSEEMEQVRVVNSKKNIPIHPRQTYQKLFINAVEVLTRNVRWVAEFYLNPIPNPQKKKVYDFRSIKAPPTAKELKPFEEAMTRLTQNIEFSPRSNQFQDNLKEELENIKQDDKLLIEADKTSNMYRIEPKKYKELIDVNVQKTYKKEEA